MPARRLTAGLPHRGAGLWSSLLLRDRCHTFTAWCLPPCAQDTEDFASLPSRAAGASVARTLQSRADVSLGIAQLSHRYSCDLSMRSESGALSLQCKLPGWSIQPLALQMYHHRYVYWEERWPQSVAGRVF